MWIARNRRTVSSEYAERSLPKRCFGNYEQGMSRRSARVHDGTLNTGWTDVICHREVACEICAANNGIRRPQPRNRQKLGEIL